MKPDLHRFPLLVAWEMTRACLLACQHCRASAVPDPLPKALLKGKCGVCEYRELCRGSRARAWAETGDHLAADPRCAYIPKGLGQMSLA